MILALIVVLLLERPANAASFRDIRVDQQFHAAPRSFFLLLIGHPADGSPFVREEYPYGGCDGQSCGAMRPCPRGTCRSLRSWTSGWCIQLSSSVVFADR